MRRAAVSISSNIAEGFSRRTSLEKNRFYAIAQGSNTELENQIIIARDVGYVDQKITSEIIEKINFIHKLINGLIKGSRDRT